MIIIRKHYHQVWTLRSYKPLQNELIWLLARIGQSGRSPDSPICDEMLNVIDIKRPFDPYVINLALTCSIEEGKICGFLIDIGLSGTEMALLDTFSEMWEKAVVSPSFPALSVIAGSKAERCSLLSWPLLVRAWHKYISDKGSLGGPGDVGRSEIPDLDRVCQDSRRYWTRDPRIGIMCDARVVQVCQGKFHEDDWSLGGFSDAINVVVINMNVCQPLAVAILNRAWDLYQGSEIPIESFSAVDLPNLKRFCGIDSESQFFKSEYLRIALLCSIPIKDVSQRIIAESILDQKPMQGHRSIITLQAIPDLVKYVRYSEEDRSKLIPAIIDAIWDEAGICKVEIFGDFTGLKNLNLKGPPDSDGGGLCTLNSLGGPTRAEPAAEAAILFMCRHSSVDAVCEFVRETASRGKSAEMMRDIINRQLDLAKFVEDMANTNLVKLSLPEYNTICSSDVAAFVAEITFMLGETSAVASARTHIEWAGFCLSHDDLLNSFKQLENPLNPICPQKEENSDSLILNTAAAIASIPQRIVRGGRLNVNRETAFSDSLALLTSITVDPNYPTSVYFYGEAGIDAGGLRRDWLGRIAAIVSEPISDDKAGNLFSFKAQAGGVEDLQLNLNPDQMVSEGRGIIHRNAEGIERLELTPFGKDVYHAFGRLMAIAFIHGEQLGMALPSYFFAKLLNGFITLDDLLPEEEDWKNSLEKFASDFKAGHDEVDVDDIFPGRIESGIFTKTNLDAMVAKLAEAIIPSYANVIMDQIRSGFIHTVPIDQVRARFLPRHLKLLIAGESLLDVDGLEAMAERMEEVPPSEVAFDLLFQWLKLQSPTTHRKFMRFVTGSPSLSTRPLKIGGPGVNQGELPNAHTCFGQLDLPNYTSIENLEERMRLAIQSEAMGMN